jgi:hypothetical protein
MAQDQRKVSVITEFLEQAFVGCSVNGQEAAGDRIAQFYRIVNDTTGKILHRVFVSRAFLDDHAEGEIVPALQDLGLLMCLRMVGSRRVLVKSQMIEIELGRHASDERF